MAARKLYEEKIMKFLKELSEEELAKVVQMIDKGYLFYDAVEEMCGKYSHVKTSSVEYAKRKREEKSLDR